MIFILMCAMVHEDRNEMTEVPNVQSSAFVISYCDVQKVIIMVIAGDAL